jgi:hypothetical protein
MLGRKRGLSALFLGSIAFAACGLTTRSSDDGQAPGGSSSEAPSSGVRDPAQPDDVAIGIPGPEGGMSTTADTPGGAAAVPSASGGLANTAGASALPDGGASPQGGTGTGGVGDLDCSTFEMAWASEGCDAFVDGVSVTCHQRCGPPSLACQMSCLPACADTCMDSASCERCSKVESLCRKRCAIRAAACYAHCAVQGKPCSDLVASYPGCTAP